MQVALHSACSPRCGRLCEAGAALAANEYYSIWTYTSELCTGEASSDLIRTENFRLWTCFDDGSGVTSIYSCDTGTRRWMLCSCSALAVMDVGS